MVQATRNRAPDHHRSAFLKEPTKTTMKDISIKELIDLATSDVPDGDARIEKMFDWHFQRNMMIAKWIMGAVASLSIAALLGYFKAEIDLNWWQSIVAIVLPLSASTYGFYRLYHIRSMHRQFVSALKIYNELKKIAPFISLYREVRK
ncbi:MAG: hypothetical protein PHN75_04860 [Syntrophales bacterium]|nr:hypothetical protein [Syntrophales bacterium]